MGLLSKVTSGKVKKPFLILLYGPEKVGKSTFGSQLPSPLFICGEDGTDQLNVNRIKPKTWAELKNLLVELAETEHDYETVVLDTIDWLEQLQIKYLMGKYHSDNIRDIAGGWGKYKNILIDSWHELFNLIDKARKKCNICFLAHSNTKKFADPINSCEYDKYHLKMQFTEISNIFKEYVDAILFVNYEVVTKKDQQSKKVRAFGSNVRVLYAEGTHAFEAGNRYGIPEELDFSAKEVLKYVNQDDSKICERLLAQIEEIKKQFEDESFVRSVSDYIEKIKDKPNKLRETINRLKIKLNKGVENV